MLIPPEIKDIKKKKELELCHTGLTQLCIKELSGGFLVLI